MNRRTATDQDLSVGTTVYKGKGATQWTIWQVRPSTGVLADGSPSPIRYYLRKAGSTSQPASRAYWAEDLTIEVAPEQTGLEMLSDLLSF